MVRDFGIMIFQDFLLLVCVYLFLMPLHVMEKKKIKNGLILCGAWCVMLAARLLIPAIGEHLIAEFFMRFVITMIAVGLISKKISWEMIYCTVWPPLYIIVSILSGTVYIAFLPLSSSRGCCNISFLSCFLRQCICFCPSHCFAGFQEMDFTRQDQEEHSQQQQCFSYPCSLTTIFIRTVENPILQFWFSYTV